MATINGAAVSWGNPDFAITETVVGSLILQGFDHSKNAENEIIRTREGERASSIWYDQTQEVTFEYFSTGSTIALAKTNAKVPAPGTILTITLTTGNYGESLNSSKAEVIASPRITGTNTSAIRISLPLRISAGITAAAS